MRFCPSAEQAATAYDAWKKEKDRILQLKQERAKREMRLAEERAAKKAEAEKVRIRKTYFVSQIIITIVKTP